MRFPTFLVVAIVFVATLIVSIAGFRTPTRADQMGMTTCSAFTSTKWVSPMPGPQPSGDRYTVTISANPMSCGQATSWAKKLIPQHIAGKPMMPDYPPLKGGPPGYLCKGSPDSSGHAWRGSCLKSGAGASQPSFTWTND